MERKKPRINKPTCDNITIISIIMELLATVLLILSADTAVAEDWPTYMHDNLRSGTTTEQLELPMQQIWIHRSVRTPRPAWVETPATQDLGHGAYPTFDHKSRVLFDRVFNVVVSGYSLYFGSSNSDKVTCLNARTGDELWKFFTGGPVRFVPTVYNGRIYFGSDDGYVYCLNSARGSLRWRTKANSGNELLFANGQLASVSPVRTSVLVEDDVAYWSTGVFPKLGRWLCAGNANTGALIWKKSPSRVAQGYLLSLGQNLYVPAGKTWPVLYKMSDGSYQNDFSETRQGGCYALIIPDENNVVFGPCYSKDGCFLTVHNTGGSIGTVNGNFLIVKNAYSYYSTDTQLFKVKRSTWQILWSVSSPYHDSLILAGDILFAGGDGEVAAFSIGTGEKLWTGAVVGRAHGLVAANGYLYVSTDQGNIHAFTYNIFDLNHNGVVDMPDLMKFSSKWLNCTNPNNSDCEKYIE
ncbi:MAG: PQQ-binding-like beta-propeller repeat protein [Gammaproteobacteria bacterium]|nr:PQQ-binding-like beta-propeller repeat protein [Gammaproteobacteria bacterium]